MGERVALPRQMETQQQVKVIGGQFGDFTECLPELDVPRLFRSPGAKILAATTSSKVFRIAP